MQKVRSINDTSLIIYPLAKIKNLRLRYVNKVVISNVNMNSLANKFKQLKELVMKHIDVLVTTKKKLSLLFRF